MKSAAEARRPRVSERRRQSTSEAAHRGHAREVDLLAERLEVLHDHAQPTHAEAVLDAALAVDGVLDSRAVVEALLSLAPVAALCKVRA